MDARASGSRRLYPRVMWRTTVTASPMARTRRSGPSNCQMISVANPAAAPSAASGEVPGGRP
eukprot:11945934-Alexandrium_andersonii.AAC.1